MSNNKNDLYKYTYSELKAALNQKQVDHRARVIEVLCTEDPIHPNSKSDNMNELLIALLEKHDSIQTGIECALEQYLEW